MKLELTTSGTADGKCRYALTWENMGEPASGHYDALPSCRNLAIGIMLLFAFARKADKYVATGLDMVPVNDADLRNIADRCAHLVIWLDEGQHSTAEAIDVVLARLPLFVRLTGAKTLPVYGLRRREWEELNALAMLIQRCVQGDDVFAGNGQLKAA